MEEQEFNKIYDFLLMQEGSFWEGDEIMEEILNKVSSDKLTTKQNEKMIELLRNVERLIDENQRQRLDLIALLNKGKKVEEAQKIINGGR
jgi:hypothetical protein